MQAHALGGAFTDPPRMAADAFRGLMNAMARPGHIETLTGAQPPAPVSSAAGALLLTLCDADTPLYLAGGLDTAALRDWITFQTGAPLTGPAEAAFAIGRWPDLVPLTDYAIGTPDYPDRSATLIVELDTLTQSGPTLRGPGIQTTAQLSVPDAAALAANHAHYPLGLDFFFTAGSQVAAVPRSTRIG